MSPIVYSSSSSQIASPFVQRPYVHAVAPQFSGGYTLLRGELLALIGEADAFMDSMRTVLIAKSKSPASAIPFHDRQAASRKEWSAKIAKKLTELFDTFDKHDRIADEFDREQQRQRAAIREHLLVQSKPKYVALTADEAATSVAEEEANKQLATTKSDLATLQAKMRDHAAAAEPINRAIANFRSRLRALAIAVCPLALYFGSRE